MLCIIIFYTISFRRCASFKSTDDGFLGGTGGFSVGRLSECSDGIGDWRVCLGDPTNSFGLGDFRRAGSGLVRDGTSYRLKRLRLSGRGGSSES